MEEGLKRVLQEITMKNQNQKDIEDGIWNVAGTMVLWYILIATVGPFLFWFVVALILSHH
jgi:hypothetical protein